MIWLIDGNNVFGSRPDGWWNDRAGATARLTQAVAEWCRTHDHDVTLVFDAPVPATTSELAGGNLSVVEAPRRGRDAADDHIVAMVDASRPDSEITVVTSDRGLIARLAGRVTVVGVTAFRASIAD